MSKIDKRQTVQEVFPDASDLNDYGGDTVEFNVEYGEVTFEKLQELSEKLGTKLINIGSGYSSGGCETCGYGESSWVKISVSGITK